VPSFAEVYKEHVFRVYGFIAYRTKSRLDAEDLTQQTFEKALRAWPRFDPARASVSTWLLAIARNVIIDRHRAARTETGLDDVPDAQLPRTSGPEEDVATSSELQAALASLSGRDREIVGLRFGADLTGPEIAQLTGLTLANVQQILSRSLRRMRDELERSSERPGATEAERRHEQQQQREREAAADEQR
jgi:RNA polymerase sigma-70 factor (ECF subfamily)